MVISHVWPCFEVKRTSYEWHEVSHIPWDQSRKNWALLRRWCRDRCRRPHSPLREWSWEWIIVVAFLAFRCRTWAAFFAWSPRPNRLDGSWRLGKRMMKEKQLRVISLRQKGQKTEYATNSNCDKQHHADSRKIVLDGLWTNGCLWSVHYNLCKQHHDVFQFEKQMNRGQGDNDTYRIQPYLVECLRYN